MKEHQSSTGTTGSIAHETSDLRRRFLLNESEETAETAHFDEETNSVLDSHPSIVRLQSEAHILQVAEQLWGIGNGGMNILYHPNKKRKKPTKLLVSSSTLKVPFDNTNETHFTVPPHLDAGRLTWVGKAKHSRKYSTSSSLNWASSDNPDGVPIVNKVMDQASCGSCWATAALGSLEASVARQEARTAYEVSSYNVTYAQAVERQWLPQLSIQQLVDCDKNNLGCVGGNPLLAFSFLFQHGVTTTKKYPYEGYKGSCKNIQKSVARATGWGILESNHENHMELALRYIGPIAVGFHGSDFDFLHYTGGIFRSRHCPQSSNHALLITGFGHDGNGTKYWIARNSWGADWGENGYVRIARSHGGHKGTLGTCGIARSPSVALGGTLLYKSIDGSSTLPQPPNQSVAVLEGHQYSPKVVFQFLELHNVYGCLVLGLLLAIMVSWMLSTGYRRRRRRKPRHLSEIIPIAAVETGRMVSYGATEQQRQPQQLRETIGVI